MASEKSALRPSKEHTNVRRDTQHTHTHTRTRTTRLKRPQFGVSVHILKLPEEGHNGSCRISHWRANTFLGRIYKELEGASCIEAKLSSAVRLPVAKAVENAEGSPSQSREA